MIVKFCKRAHNPFLAQTKIQLCTVSYYKSVDNDFIRDIDEGQVSRSYHPSGRTAYTGDEIGKMTGHSISGTGTIRFRGRAVKTTNPIPNAYIFCTNDLEQPTLRKAALLGYDSFYIVKDPDLFSERIAERCREYSQINLKFWPFTDMYRIRKTKMLHSHNFLRFYNRIKLSDHIYIY